MFYYHEQSISSEGQNNKGNFSPFLVFYSVQFKQLYDTMD